MAEKLGCTDQDFQPRYVEHYRRACRVLGSRLPELGEGRHGFVPPF